MCDKFPRIGTRSLGEVPARYACDIFGAVCRTSDDLLQFPDVDTIRNSLDVPKLENETRYSPAKCIGCDMKAVSGNPDFRHVSTSFVERQNWTVRTTMRRYTRLSNGFSRKLRNHAAATALNYFAYNFIKIHRTLRMRLRWPLASRIGSGT